MANKKISDLPDVALPLTDNDLLETEQPAEIAGTRSRKLTLSQLFSWVTGKTAVDTIPASETLSAGNIVNIWDDAGTTKVRKAKASVGFEAHGFVLSAAAISESVPVFFSGKNTALSGLTPGATYYLSTTAGAITATAPGAVNNVWQPVGEAFSATGLNFQKQISILIKATL